MSALSLIEKLINEHASAAVLEKHLALLKEQIMFLEKENASLKIKNKALDADNKNLVLELSHCQRKKDDNKSDSFHDIANNLSETEVSVLKALASDKHQTNELSDTLKMNSEAVLFHLRELENKHFVIYERIPMLDDWWTLDHNGQKYLVENNLLP